PSVQSFFSVSTRSSVQVMPQIPRQSSRRRSPDGILLGPGQRPVGPTHTRATDLRYDLSAARSVVFDDGKATIWREARAKTPTARLPSVLSLLTPASAPIFKHVQSGHASGGWPRAPRSACERTPLTHNQTPPP